MKATGTSDGRGSRGRGAAGKGVSIGVQRLRPLALLPVRMSAGASGWDLSACLESPLSLEPGRWAVVPTGIALGLPMGYEAQVRARSGLAARCGIGLLNAPGTVDSDYRGEICVILMNWGPERFEIKHGDRIAQLVFMKTAPVRLAWIGQVDETDRGAGGFGHTGIGRGTRKSP